VGSSASFCAAATPSKTKTESRQASARAFTLVFISVRIIFVRIASTMALALWISYQNILASMTWEGKDLAA
jgi:hypothetical protein